MGLRDWLQQRQQRAETQVLEREAHQRSTLATTSAPATNPDERSTHWVPGNQRIQVGPYMIPGLVYVGRGMSTVSNWGGTEPALIDPKLSVDQRRVDWSGEAMGYWPSYDRIAAGNRAAYLSWLAGGRQTNAYIGYVFLFFYGLERRALIDAQHDPIAEAELPAIRAEVARLKSLYGESRSFHGYATAFVDVLDVLLATESIYHNPPPDSPNWWEMPAGLKVGLGQLAADGVPVPAPWALAWVRAHPEARIRTAAKRCPDEFNALFAHRYAKRYGSGMVLKANKTRLSVAYRPASASFGGMVELTIGTLPDVSVLTAPLRKLAEIAHTCTEELDPFSRWLGRNPDDAGSLKAMALLPTELLADRRLPELDRLRDWADQRLASKSYAVIDGTEILANWPGWSDDKLGKADSVAFCGLLDRLGFGLEPDVRFGGPPLAKGPMVLFRANGNAVPSDAYSAAAVLLQLGATVGVADGNLSAVEQRHLAQHIESAVQLGSGEKWRLNAHLAWLAAARPSLSGMKKKLAAFDVRQRSEIGALLVAVAAVDGTIAPAEVNSLTKIFGQLGLEQAKVYSQLHALGADDDPVTVSPARPSRPGEPVPPAARASHVNLDPARIRARLAESAEVAALLASVFVEDVPETFVTVEGVETLAGLDEAHSQFLRALSARPLWPQVAFDEAATQEGLLPVGAMDVINEASIELCGEPLCGRVDEGIELNGYALEGLLQ